MFVTVGFRAALDHHFRQQPVVVALVLVLLSAFVTTWHWVAVDTQLVLTDPRNPQAGSADYYVAFWQLDLYDAVLNRQKERLYPLDPTDLRGQWESFSFVPHVFRPLPYGFVRTLELITRDWQFSCFAYRWFFTYWFLWGCYGFVRHFHSAAAAWLTLGVVVVLYPFSLWYYLGQLTDPMSHALFVMSLIFLVQDRWLLLALTLFLGVLAKETVLILVVSYAACYVAREGWPAVLKTVALSLACLIAYLGARVPLGWKLEFGSINATKGLMITSNLGIGRALYPSPAPIYLNYVFPLIFVGTFIPLIAWNWRRADRRLRVLFVTAVPLLLISNLCFGWMHEARNYLPLAPLLMALSVPPEFGRPGKGRIAPA
jgi:hypothetical protein